VKTFAEGFDQLRYAMNGAATNGTHEISFRAYDRFFNCGYKTVSLEMARSGVPYKQER
jgi:hypothetical protein